MGSTLVALRVDHLEAVLHFERENRAWFARSITDPGDGVHAALADRHRSQLAEQAAGGCAFYVLIDADDGSIAGRFNLYDLRDGEADVGYRMAERATGQGLATEAVLELCRLAAAAHGLRLLRACARADNVASQRVLIKAGFAPVGPREVAGRPGLGFERSLTAADTATTAGLTGDLPLRGPRARSGG